MYLSVRSSIRPDIEPEFPDDLSVDYNRGENKKAQRTLRNGNIIILLSGEVIFLLIE